MPIKPDFFIVGAPKCGTTSLASYLAEHPDIHVSPIKEPNYFGRDLVKKPDLTRISLEDYLALFEDSSKKICGEASTWYLYSKTAAQEIYHFNPDAKIIIMLRNPVDFLYSYHSQLLIELIEDIEDFLEALKAEDSRKEGKKIPSRCFRPSALLYSEVARFSEQVLRYVNTFGRKKVHIVIFEDFIDDTSQSFSEVLSFLGVAPFELMKFKKYNSNSVVKHKYAYQLFLDLNRSLRLVGRSFFKELFFYSKLKSIYSGIIRSDFVRELFLERRARMPLDRNLRDQLTCQYRDEIDRLSNLLDIDLSRWDNLR